MTSKPEKRSGSYSTRVSLTDPDTGRRIQPRITARTKRDLDAQVADLKSRWNNGTFIEPNTMPLREYMDEWFTKYRKAGSTRYTREGAIKNKINSHRIGSIPLGKLKHSHIQDWIDELAADYAPSYVEQIAVPLRMALRRAAKVGVIPTNPADHLDMPSKIAPQWTIWSEEQVGHFIGALDRWQEPNRALWILAVMLGIRRGELIGLRWSDIDLQAGTIAIQRTGTRTEAGKWVIGELPKTSHSQRTIRLPEVCTRALRQHRTEQLERRLKYGPAWVDSGAVFDTGLGDHWATPFRLYDRFRKLIDKVNAIIENPDDRLPVVRPHDLRHTAATHMIRRQVPVPTVAKILGHKTPAITMRVYAHVLDDMQRDATDIIDRMYGSLSPDRAQTVPTG